MTNSFFETIQLNKKMTKKISKLKIDKKSDVFLEKVLNKHKKILNASKH